MGGSDIVWMVIILGAAGYLLYHSLWKKKGHCSGCEGCSCPSGAKTMTTGKGMSGNEKKSCC